MKTPEEWHHTEKYVRVHRATNPNWKCNCDSCQHVREIQADATNDLKRISEAHRRIGEMLAERGIEGDTVHEAAVNMVGEFDRLKAIEVAARMVDRRFGCIESLEYLKDILAATPESARAEAAKREKYVQALEAVAEAARNLNDGCKQWDNFSQYNGGLEKSLAKLADIRAK